MKIRFSENFIRCFFTVIDSISDRRTNLLPRFTALFGYEFFELFCQLSDIFIILSGGHNNEFITSDPVNR